MKMSWFKNAVLIVLVIVAGCRGRSDSPGKQERGVATTQPIAYDIDSTLVQQLPWVDPLTAGYVRRTKNELIRNAVKAGEEESWLWDQLLATDTATFVVLHIGHSFESHFVTDGWLYIDTATKKMYEYDVADERLTPWLE